MNRPQKIVIGLGGFLATLLFLNLGLSIIDASKHPVFTTTSRFRLIENSFYVFVVVLATVTLFVLLGKDYTSESEE